jgi:hypothetical protein
VGPDVIGGAQSGFSDRFDFGFETRDFVGQGGAGMFNIAANFF